MRIEGVIKSWNDERGFGFIEPTQGGQEIFVHVKAFRTRAERPKIGQLVSFEVELGTEGKKRAKNVEPIRVVRSRRSVERDSPAQWGTATLFAIPAFLILFAIVAVLWRPPRLVAGIYVGVSMITFIAYFFDKSAATRGAWRTSETTLHSLSLIGGWPGALLAQQFLRHKTVKAEFRAVFWGTVAVNVIAFVVLCSPVGRSLWAAQ
ncbi:MAG: Cold shock-like protein CspG [Accumulibacter sp.]|uniref:cold shock and DUF1294 domain-containing protein n=1 Tax=Accumulibacter sp. TaxID=2053492 RepID=UPI00120DD063|nr:cold shock and DUF1294 domain-containing protein [Accumulibacter sp.]QKS30446.1 MAG: DUF1294 domain-containing protein [Candidatus Accumulibacter similis]TLD44633.1 MAG: Cold shock-like protein CspG [Accumulibacter sp.]